MASVLAFGLAVGWVAGSAWPWSLIPIIAGLAFSGVWVAWEHVQLTRDMDTWAKHAETARRLLDEADDDE